MGKKTNKQKKPTDFFLNKTKQKNQPQPQQQKPPRFMAYSKKSQPEEDLWFCDIQRERANW